jgi:glutathione S-transferase
MNDSQQILYSFRRCPYAMRARMALSYANVTFQHREILLKDKPASMLAFSAKGTVPVFIVCEEVIDESLAIMYWSLKKNDPDKWFYYTNNKAQIMINELIESCDNRFKKQLDFYKYSDRYERSEIHYRDESLWFLEDLNKLLSRTKNLVSDQVSLADIAIFPFIRQYAFVNKTWFDEMPFQNLQRWLDYHLTSNLFTSIMQKHQLWVEK